ncbi:hypothetical protein LAG90_10775 [Marinilongibacter aquaticus]|uniref:hypothetical protein n=1 Tax=Marinilongibacter aquaticus TaxID=2975157 RepID=UPI0021BD6DBB|nr:hypothetical protein [Marinilongibacter aquaticus]UBM57302.1 hypothetical protein LAG90_10775 [Marinilongibacter aquaticus]
MKEFTRSKSTTIPDFKQITHTQPKHPISTYELQFEGEESFAIDLILVPKQKFESTRLYIDYSNKSKMHWD